MSGKEKANLELTFKNLLYCIDNVEEQEKMISILVKYNNELPDGRLKEKVQDFLLSKKKDYYDKVDFLIKDILNGGNEEKRKILLPKMLKELQPVVEKAERSFWDKFCDLFKWS